jgi:hypothetical protein
MSDLSNEDILQTSEAQQRIEELEAWMELHPGEWLSSDEAAEYDTLVMLRDAVDLEWPGTWGKIPLVRESYWGKFAAWYASNAYGEATETVYWDDKRYADDLRAACSEIEFDRVTYLGDGT